jgi:hypothetical protein
VTLDILPEEGDDFPARFGVRELVRVNGPETWEDARTRAYHFIDVFAEAIQLHEAPESLPKVLLEAGARPVACSSCGEYLNGLAEWPGLWCALDEEGPSAAGRVAGPPRMCPEGWWRDEPGG